MCGDNQLLYSPLNIAQDTTRPLVEWLRTPLGKPCPFAAKCQGDELHNPVWDALRQHTTLSQNSKTDKSLATHTEISGPLNVHA